MSQLYNLRLMNNNDFDMLSITVLTLDKNSYKMLQLSERAKQY